MHEKFLEMATGQKMKNAAPRRAAKKRERWSWNKESKQALDSLREFVATGKALPDGILPKFDFAVEQILKWHQQWAIQCSSADKKANSVAAKVMIALARNASKKVVAEWYANARASSRRVFFDCMVRTILVSRGGVVAEDLNEAVMLRAVVEEPATLLSEKDMLDLFVSAMQQRRGKFLQDLGADMNNYDARSDKLDVNELLLEVARHWVDCHCPMWLMSRKAIMKAAKALAPGHPGWSEESLKRVLRDVELNGSAKRPIEDLSIKNGRIVAFHVMADFTGGQPLKVAYTPTGSSKAMEYVILPTSVKKNASELRVDRRLKG